MTLYVFALQNHPLFVVLGLEAFQVRAPRLLQLSRPHLTAHRFTFPGADISYGAMLLLSMTSSIGNVRERIEGLKRGLESSGSVR